MSTSRRGVKSPRDLFRSAAPDLVQALIARARAGDMDAITLCLERGIRTDFSPKATLLEQVTALKTSVCEGRLSASEAGVMGRLMALELALTTAAEGGKGLSAEDVIRLLNSEVLNSEVMV